MSDSEFKSKYQTSKKTFQKRYVKSDGDTYTMGKKKQAVALGVLAATGHPITAVKSAIYDYGKAAIDTHYGYKDAEKKYKNRR